MRFGIRTLDELDVKGKTVLCRVDINQPVDRAKGTLKSVNRIRACVPTVRELSDKGAKVVLMAHQGSDIEYKNFYTTRPHAPLREGEVLLLDNVRFVAEEQTLFEMKLRLTHEQQAKTLLVEKLAPLGDLYVCDAFAAAHRDQPSLCGFEQVLPSAMGRLFEKEYCTVSGLMEAPERPCVFILGGAKISDAFQMMETVLSRGVADRILTGGLVANIFLIALGQQIGQGSYDFIAASNYTEFFEKAKALYEAYGNRIVLPVDLSWVQDGRRQEGKLGAIPADVAAVDIGADDSITATEKYGLTDKMGYICTGGGALIRFLSGEELPVVKALRHGSSLPL